MWITKKKYKEITDTKKEIDYLSTLIHGIKHDIAELKTGSNRLPVSKKNSNELVDLPQKSKVNNNAIDCMTQHIKIFIKQAGNGTIADFGEPCAECPHSNECNYKWISIMDPLLKHASIKINMVRSEH